MCLSRFAIAGWSRVVAVQCACVMPLPQVYWRITISDHDVTKGLSPLFPYLIPDIPSRWQGNRSETSKANHCPLILLQIARKTQTSQLNAYLYLLHVNQTTFLAIFSSGLAKSSLRKIRHPFQTTSRNWRGTLSCGRMGHTGVSSVSKTSS